MFYKEDWVMKHIRLLIGFIRKLVLKEDDVFDEENAYSFSEVDRLLDSGKIDEAENLFFSWKDRGLLFFNEVLQFYEKLNDMTDEELKSMGFSREEIQEGLVDYFDMVDLNIRDLVKKDK